MSLSRPCRIVLLLVPALLLWACRGKPKNQSWIFEELLGDEKASAVTFDFKGFKSSDIGLCTYWKDARIAKFRVQLFAPACSKPANKGDYQMCSGRGKFIAETGSDPAVLLHDLQISLKAKSLPTRVERVSELPFEYVRFGEQLSRTPKGGLVASPNGTWTAMKLFLGEGENEGQVFFNVSPDTGHGEFSIKDAEYGDIVVAELAKVL